MVQLNFLIGLALLFLVGTCCGSVLSPNFYRRSCPSALSVIKSKVEAAVANERRMGASLIRLHFHDCFVNGCDGSILLDGATGEKTAPPNNNSVRGFEVIDDIKSELERLCPNIVSCADILTVAARDSVVALGGASWTVPLGRRDSTTASFTAASTQLPSPFDDLDQLISSFRTKGFSIRELVVLSGAHTIGKAGCATFRDRIYNERNIDPSFAESLKGNCPLNGGDRNLADLDLTTPTEFDNAYFKNLLSKKGLLHSDQQLYNGGITDNFVNTYSINPALFRLHFANAMVKMGNLSPLTGSSGQVRINCRRVN